MSLEHHIIFLCLAKIVHDTIYYLCCIYISNILKDISCTTKGVIPNLCRILIQSTLNNMENVNSMHRQVQCICSLLSGDLIFSRATKGI
jgi:hypothetical protein